MIREPKQKIWASRGLVDWSGKVGPGCCYSEKNLTNKPPHHKRWCVYKHMSLFLPLSLLSVGKWKACPYLITHRLRFRFEISQNHPPCICFFSFFLFLFFLEHLRYGWHQTVPRPNTTSNDAVFRPCMHFGGMDRCDFCFASPCFLSCIFSSCTALTAIRTWARLIDWSPIGLHHFGLSYWRWNHFRQHGSIRIIRQRIRRILSYYIFASLNSSVGPSDDYILLEYCHCYYYMYCYILRYFRQRIQRYFEIILTYHILVVYYRLNPSA